MNGASSNGDIVQANDTAESRDVDEEQQETSHTSEPHSPLIPDDHSSGVLNRKEAMNDSHNTGFSEQALMEQPNGLHQEASQSKRNSINLSQTNPAEQQDLPNTSDKRLEAMLKEREVLREEVARVRHSLEEMQERHEEELSSIREQLSQTEDEKESAETQYQNLLGKVNTIRSQLGERLKADAVRL